MAKAEDFTGKEFDKIKILGRAKDRATPSGQKRIFWTCECLLCGEKAKGRDMSELQSAGTAAAKASPKSGRFTTNINAKDWHLISPEGKHYYFRSLNFWLRENCRKLFGCEPDSWEYINVASRLRNAKCAVLGRKYPCCTYKGWQVIPINN